MARTKPIRSILAQGGQGDGLMAVYGLHALMQIQEGFLSQDACFYTRTLATPLVQALLPEIRADSLSESQGAPRPRYHTSSKTSWTTVFRNRYSGDFYHDFAQRRRLASYGYPRPGFFERMLQRWADETMAAGTRWHRETPVYYGHKMWAPLAEAWDCTEIDLMRGHFLSYPVLAGRMHSLAVASPLPPECPEDLDLAIFPSGASFQFLPPAFLRDLTEQAGLSPERFRCFFAPKDPLRREFEEAGLPCVTTPSLESILGVVGHARVTATCDSFVSHVAQLGANIHLAFMSHDLPVHTLHPAAASLVIFHPLGCCPCHYRNRTQQERCFANSTTCKVFSEADYLRQGVQALQETLGCSPSQPITAS
ncbi:MAG: hypothetical protein HQL56_01735 [Magnetococcales bacterium]|nr:hypothetical protein [Magnetococcales bacterium]